MVYINTPSPWGKVFAVPACVVEEHLRFASHNALKILLLCLGSNGEHLSPEQLAKQLHMNISDVTDALTYWSKAKILTVTEDTVQTEAPPPEKSADATSKPLSQPLTESAPVLIETVHPVTGQKISKKTHRPKITPEDIARLRTDRKDLDVLFQEAQQLVNRSLSPMESECIAALLMYYEFPAEVALNLLAVWRQTSPQTTHRLETLAQEWSDAGIFTFEQASAEAKRMSELHQWEQFALHAMQSDKTSLTPKEKFVVLSWMRKGFSRDLIGYACEQTQGNHTKEKPVSYANKLLCDWQEKGISQVDGAKAEVLAFHAQKEVESSKKKRPAVVTKKKQNTSAKTGGSSLPNEDVKDYLSNLFK